MKTEQAIKHLGRELQKDPEYYFSWQSNIAMSFLDELSKHGCKIPNAHTIANLAAKNFLNLLINQTKMKIGE